MINPLELYRRYKDEEARWIAAGRPMRNADSMKRIHTICAGCKFFNPKGGWIPGYDKCNICQCNLHPSNTGMNKLAWATTKCPSEEPLWGTDASL